MFTPFLETLRSAGVPVSLREYLSFLAALRADLAVGDPEAFYHLARLTMVKDERHIDRFDRAFAACFRGLETIAPEAVLEALALPPDWLERARELALTPEERARVEALGGLGALLDALRQRLAEQRERHEGGSKWIGTGGTSPFGAHGYNPEGVRIGQDAGRHGRAVKVWDQRTFRDYDDGVEIGTRSLRVALHRLRRWAREGAAEELDLDGTVRATAERGWLDLKTRRERRNAVRVLLFLDTGGSMDSYVRLVEELFSAARSEFKYLDVFYFHNCPYESLWRENARRREQQIRTEDILHSYGAAAKCIFVGDASMSPYEISHAGGAAEHWNAEPGAAWLQRMHDHWPASLWINPVPEAYWGLTRSIGMIQALMGGAMVPLTLDGLNRGIRLLGH